MIIRALKSKIHRATVTEADLNYVGSISIDRRLMDAANLLPFEQVQILNITNGNRLETYVIEAQENSGEICINGAAAHLVSPSDIIIIVSYCSLQHNDLKKWTPSVVHVNQKNQIIDIKETSPSMI
ncbi:MAG: aspartate 1-decarboxylase [Candidatus Marinimicrobia bacterium]|nr:aspartate 1-decarboxylase [Candidatus Neomarinimicrobiota bacterium]